MTTCETNAKKLSEENLGLVHLCANRFRGKGIEYDDLFGAGCIGLLKAARAFDPSRGTRFSTYAVPVILGEIKRLFRDGGAVKVSRSLKELSLKIQRLREKYLAENGREPAVSELAETLDESEENVTLALASSLPPISLTAADSDDENDTRQIDIPTAPPDEQIMNRLALRKELSLLEKSDRRLLYLRYFALKTQTETAKLLGMSQVQVSRREKKLLLMLRSRL